MVAEGRRPSTMLDQGSFLNAIVALAAIGGSTNAVVHLLAIAGRLGIDLTLDDFDRTGAGVPLLVDLQPAGRHLMEDFHRAGGLLAVLREVQDLLDPDALTVTGRPLVEHLDEAQIWDDAVIRRARRAAAGQRGHRRAARQPRARPAPSSNPPPPRRSCSATAAGPSSSTASRTCTPGSTTPISTSMPTRCSCCAGCGPKGYPGMPEVAEHAAAHQAPRTGRP